MNNRKFTLLGDPALTLAFPRYKVQTTTINGAPLVPPPGSAPGPPIVDTLKALNQYTIGGVVVDNSGALLPGFAGTLYATVYDKPHTLTTLGNNPGSVKAGFEVQDNVLYKGQGAGRGGTIQFFLRGAEGYQLSIRAWEDQFLCRDGERGDGGIGRRAGSFLSGLGGLGGGGVPARAVLAGGRGNGRVRELGRMPMRGERSRIFWIGASGGGVTGAPGPAIQAYLNDEKFVDGGITNQDPILILHLADSVGINIVGTGIGHDITAILDNDVQNPVRAQ